MADIEPSIKWQIATVASVQDASLRVKLFKLDLERETKFRAGQYFDVRLTAPDGYQAQRSYSVTSSPTDPKSIELAIELIEDGEVSSYFHEFVETGDKIEVRGPIGGHFTLSPNYSRPLLLIAGGSGIAPIVSMLRHRHAAANDSPTSLMFSARTQADILFLDDLEQIANDSPGFRFSIALTRETNKTPLPHFASHGRFSRASIENAIGDLTQETSQTGGTSTSLPARAYICGGSGFVESMGGHLLEMGMKFDDIRTERFGP